LRQLVEAHNLTNAALLERNRLRYEQEQARAEAIHDYKRLEAYDLRVLYLREEPALLDAIRMGNRRDAVEVLNRILVAMHHHGGDRLELVKSYAMELVTAMCRAAVQTGGDPATLLGANYHSMTELSAIDSEEALRPWLTNMLNVALDAIAAQSRRSGSAQILKAVEHMRAHCAEPLSREDAAKAAGMSPSHFSRMFRKHMGRSFTDVLNQIRVNRACANLAQSDKSLMLIALESGFSEQSYFHKVFRRYLGMTPGEYRRRRRSPAP
jgi:AraC-like DNA-binding protein